MKNKIIICAIIIAVIAFSFWYGGNSPSLRGWKVPKENEVVTENVSEEEKKESVQNTAQKETQTQEETQETFPKTEAKIPEKDEYMTDPVPEGKPLPVEPENSVITDAKQTCTLSVKCDTILNNVSWLDEEKKDIVPKDGIIFPETSVIFYEGESVFNILLREMKRNKIHMEFENVPIYNSAYVRGIANLYEFDCGELSGWMYKVNGWFPNYGCSRYSLKEGDKVEWVFTCDLGKDVGGSYSSNGKR